MTKFITVSKSFRHTAGENSLAEDFKSILAVRDQFDALMLTVEVLRHNVRSREAKEMLAELECGLGDLRHDASVGAVVELAREAYHEIPTMDVPR